MCIEYTRDELKTLGEMSQDVGSIPEILESVDYDPEEFKRIMKTMPKQYKLLYETPYEDLFLMMDKPTGFTKWRLQINK